MLIAGVLSTLTTIPSNVIITKGENVTMQCSTDQTSGGRPEATWTHDSTPAVYGACMVYATRTERYASEAVDANTCAITGLGSASIGNQGAYHCTDAAGTVAEAVAVLIGMQFLLQFMKT